MKPIRNNPASSGSNQSGNSVLLYPQPGLSDIYLITTLRSPQLSALDATTQTRSGKAAMIAMAVGMGAVLPRC
jgi:hypothetical protein